MKLDIGWAYCTRFKVVAPRRTMVSLTRRKKNRQPTDVRQIEIPAARLASILSATTWTILAVEASSPRVRERAYERFMADRRPWCVDVSAIEEISVGPTASS
jgi:hypothetical protein